MKQAAQRPPRPRPAIAACRTCSRPRHPRRVRPIRLARAPRPLGDRRARTAGEHSAVTWNRLNRAPSSATRVMVGVAIGPPNALGFPNPASSIKTSSTLGALSGGVTCPMKSQSGTEPASVRFAVPLNAVPATGSLVRSNGASAMAMPSSLHLPSRALGPQPTARHGTSHHPPRTNTAPSPKITAAAWGHTAAHPGMPDSIAQREPSTQKLDQCRRARTAGSGCAQPAGQSSSAAYRTAARRAFSPSSYIT